jgi:tetratricopeptide (TPR) repeat protein
VAESAKLGNGKPKPWVWPVAIALLPTAASVSGILNQYAQDDIAIIWKNPAMHDLRGIGQFFVKSFWPPPFIPALYRPLASISFALQWAVGGGSPLIFRVVSYALYAGCSVAVFRLARTRLPIAPAAAAAALFAVHPVHVEAVALGVNQNEIWVGLIACVMVLLYLRDRSGNTPLSTRTQLLLGGLYLAACLLKENALILPGLLVAAEVVLVPATESVAARFSRVRPLFLLLMLIGVVFFWVRIRVLSGSVAGTYTAEGLFGLTMGGRALTMLAVVPHWFRLLLWPAHLQADYAPEEIVGQTTWGPMQTLGALLLVGTIVLAILARRRAPMITFGLAWCAVALFPVHNVLLPTGIVLAERTLFLPSIGAMITLGGVGALLLERAGSSARLALAGLVSALLVLGVYRSSDRQSVWSDQFNLWYPTANVDAPRSFRAHEAMAETYFNIGMERMAEQEYHLAMQFSPKLLTGASLDYAHRLRSRGYCSRATELYHAALRIRPGYMPALAPLIACLLDLGYYREAKFQTRLAISADWRRPFFQGVLATADSALRAGALPGTVRLSLPASDELADIMRIGKKP